jgi:hypothetical protein
MVSNNVRIGVMPIPPAMSSTLGRLERCAVKAPYGPSAHTRVPGRSRASSEEWSPSDFTVMRSTSARVGADRE